MGLIKRHVRKQIRKRITRPAKARVKRATLHWCAECQKNVPLFHTCVIKTDFKRRKARAKTRSRRNAKSKSTPRQRRDSHPYQSCTDQDCPRQACTAYREGMASCNRAHV